MLLSRSEFKRLSYDGFYTMVLEKDAEIISVALLRYVCHGFRNSIFAKKKEFFVLFCSLHSI
jgi:cell division FtsZ-interacting protein ZapD